jgi:preprotein translocase subunit SecB
VSPSLHNIKNTYNFDKNLFFNNNVKQYGINVANYKAEEVKNLVFVMYTAIIWRVLTHSTGHVLSVCCTAFNLNYILFKYYRVMVTHLTTTVFLYHNPENGRTYGGTSHQ